MLMNPMIRQVLREKLRGVFHVKRWLVTTKTQSFLVYAEHANQAFDVVWRFCAEHQLTVPEHGPKVVKYAGTWDFTANQPVDDATAEPYTVF